MNKTKSFREDDQEFTNIQELAKKHKGQIYVPSRLELDNISIGDYVKVNIGAEFFWVKVERSYREQLFGYVKNDLQHTKRHGLSLDSMVRILRRNVYAIQNGK
jgi:hypothetical protein